MKYLNQGGEGGTPDRRRHFPYNEALLTPDFQEFRRLAAGHTLVPVARTIPADLLTPVAAFLALA